MRTVVSPSRFATGPIRMSNSSPSCSSTTSGGRHSARPVGSVENWSVLGSMPPWGSLMGVLSWSVPVARLRGQEAAAVPSGQQDVSRVKTRAASTSRAYGRFTPRMEFCPQSNPRERKAFVFYIRYLGAELRRRPGRTALTALGVAVGVGLVVVVGALSKGLDDAQEEVLEPLTGVGTDLSVSRPIAVADEGGSSAAGPAGAFAQLSPREQRQLERENDNTLSFDLADLGDPGERFSVDRFLTTELSFPTAEAAAIRNLDGAGDAAVSLTLNAVHIEGRVPEASTPGGAALHGGSFDRP